LIHGGCLRWGKKHLHRHERHAKVSHYTWNVAHLQPSVGNHSWCVFRIILCMQPLDSTPTHVGVLAAPCGVLDMKAPCSCFAMQKEKGVAILVYQVITSVTQTHSHTPTIKHTDTHTHQSSTTQRAFQHCQCYRQRKPNCFTWWNMLIAPSSFGLTFGVQPILCKSGTIHTLFPECDSGCRHFFSQVKLG